MIDEVRIRTDLEIYNIAVHIFNGKQLMASCDLPASREEIIDPCNHAGKKSKAYHNHIAPANVLFNIHYAASDFLLSLQKRNPYTALKGFFVWIPCILPCNRQNMSSRERRCGLT
jgi:hypothetical protein